MSFADFTGGGGGGSRGAGEPGSGSSSGATADEPFAATCASVEGSIFQMTTGVSTFKRLVDLLGTGKDTRELRGRLHRQSDSLNKMAKETSAGVRRLSELVDSSGGVPAGTPVAQAKARRTKLVKDFDAVLKEFQKAQRVSAEREGSFLPQADPRPSPSGRQSYQRGGGDAEPLLSGRSEEEEPAAAHQRQEELNVVKSEIEYNDALIAEREAGMVQIQSSIVEVQEIFQDLAVLVNEQGEKIDDIEANIVRTSAKTREAQRELTQALAPGQSCALQ